MTCKICEKRRPRRFCPGVRGDICSVCCGTEREVTVTCPFECEYLQEARRHERPPHLQPEQLPNRDIHLSEEFIVEHHSLLGFASRALFEIAATLPGAVDFDIREALDSLIRTYRTLESGLIYETRPTNLVSAGIHQRFQEALAAWRRQIHERTGAAIRDAEVLGILVFLQHAEMVHNNGRRGGRAFMDFLRASSQVESSPIIQVG